MCVVKVISMKFSIQFMSEKEENESAQIADVITKYIFGSFSTPSLRQMSGFVFAEIKRNRTRNTGGKKVGVLRESLLFNVLEKMQSMPTAK